MAAEQRRNGARLAVVAACACLAGCGFAGSGPELTELPDGGTNLPKVQERLATTSSIPVLVDDVPITRFDIDQRTRLMRLAGTGGGRDAAIEELINETLQVSEGRRVGVAVPEDRVDAAYERIAGGLNMNTVQLTQALNSEGIESTSLKRRLRAQMIWRGLVQRRSLAQTTSVSQTDIAAELQQQDNQEALELREYFLQRIVFVVPSGSPSSRLTQRRAEANSYRQRYPGCEQAIQQAGQLSEVVVTNLGRRTSSELTGARGEEIKATSVGRATPPQNVDNGVELIGVCDIRVVHSTAAAAAVIQNKFALEQAQDLGRDYLQELRDAAIIEYR